MGLLDEKAADMMEAVMDRHGIRPGELLEQISKTLKLIEEFKPVGESMAETSRNLENDIDDLHNQISRFNQNSEEMIRALDDLSETLDKFHDLFEGMEED